MTATIHARIEHWPLARPFAISRGVRHEATTLVVEITEDGHTGRGEAVPYPRFGETPEGTLAAVQAIAAEDTLPDRPSLAARLPAGAARNALDCALWDLESKRTGRPVWDLAGLSEPQPTFTAYTISLGEPAEMARAAAEAKDRPLLKIKLGGDPGQEASRLTAVRRAAPDARLVVDANEGWSPGTLTDLAPVLAKTRVELVEQPLPEGADAELASLHYPVPLCADESCRTRTDLARTAALYDYVNVKLDKAGGLTEALALCEEAKERELGIFLGCMLAGSLAIAPAMLLAEFADYVDLDGPLHLRLDRLNGLRVEDSLLHPPRSELWG